MLGFLQIGVSSLASSAIVFFNSDRMLPVVAILTVTSWIGMGIYLIGRRQITQLRFMEEKGANPLPH
jgi:hypothetical protein